MPKFTPEEVREWGAANDRHNTTLIESFLRSKGLLQENKPLLREQWYAMIGTKNPTALSVQAQAIFDAHQSALDKVRDKLRKIACGESVCFDGVCRRIREIDEEAVREGCWSPEAK